MNASLKFIVILIFSLITSLSYADKKISLLKKTIHEIKNISENLDNDHILEKKIEELNKELSRLKKGINESIEELEEFIEEENA